MTPRRTLLSLAAASLAVATTLAAREASADRSIKSPNPPKYSVEIEPKLNLAYHYC